MSLSQEAQDRAWFHFELWASSKLRIDLFAGITDAPLRRLLLAMYLRRTGCLSRPVIGPDSEACETWLSLFERTYGVALQTLPELELEAVRLTAGPFSVFIPGQPLTEGSDT